MKLEVQTKAQNLQKEMALLKEDAREFRHHLNMAALRSQAPAYCGSYELAQYLKKFVDEWEKNHLQKLNQVYDSL